VKKLFLFAIFFFVWAGFAFCRSLIVSMSKVQYMPFLKVSDLTTWLGLVAENPAFEKTFRLTTQNVAQLLAFLNMVGSNRSAALHAQISKFFFCLTGKVGEPGEWLPRCTGVHVEARE